jgi:hypothetical protein
MILAFIIPSTLHALDAQKFELAYTVSEAAMPKELFKNLYKATALSAFEGEMAKWVTIGREKRLPEGYVNVFIGMGRENFLQAFDIMTKGEEFDEFMRKFYVKVSLIVAQSLSQEELKQILQFITSPTGKKWSALGPSIMKTTSELSDIAAKTIGPSFESNFERIINQKTSDLEKMGRLPKNFGKNFE